MHSSTSNSSSRAPHGPWGRTWLVTVVFVTALLGAYELWGRSCGFAPRLVDTPELWCRVRQTVGTGQPEETVIVGSSRVLCGIDGKAYAEVNGTTPPVHLGVLGSSPVLFLEDLAETPQFRGTVLCGLTPHVFFHPSRQHHFIAYWKEGPEAMWRIWEEALAKPLRSLLACCSQDMSIRLIGKSILVNKGRVTPAQFVTQPDRSVRLNIPPSLFEHEKRQRLKQYNVPSPRTEELQEVFARITAATQKIRRRGGQVIFVRMPSVGAMLELEERLYPRAAYWDELLRRTGEQGVHFRDYDALQGYPCPDRSHLDASARAPFSAALARIVMGLPQNGMTLHAN